jgi:hypothetical protein
MFDWIRNKFIKYYLKKFSKIVNKDIKITIYDVNSFNKKYYDLAQKSLFSKVNNHMEDGHSSDDFSSPLTNNNLNNSKF